MKENEILKSRQKGLNFQSPKEKELDLLKEIDNFTKKNHSNFIANNNEFTIKKKGEK